MRNGALERALRRPFGVGVDPLTIPRRVGEQVDLLLRDLYPLGRAETLPDQAEQVGWLFENSCHT